MCKYINCNDYILNFLIDLQDVLRHGGKKESVMKNTVKRLPVTLAIPFLKEVCCLHHTNTNTCLDLLFIDNSHFFYFCSSLCTRWKLLLGGESKYCSSTLVVVCAKESWTSFSCGPIQPSCNLKDLVIHEWNK